MRDSDKRFKLFLRNMKERFTRKNRIKSTSEIVKLI